MVTLEDILSAISGIEAPKKELCVEQIKSAIETLKTAQAEMNTIPVCGRHDVDALLGCMIGIDLIIGEEKHG